jgi:hypothetical protein
VSFIQRSANRVKLVPQRLEQAAHKLLPAAAGQRRDFGLERQFARGKFRPFLALAGHRRGEQARHRDAQE